MPKIKVNDVNLYYEIHGAGPPLILIPGFCGDSMGWKGIVNAYADHYQVILVDNRGAGQSDCPDYLYTVEMMADDVVALAKNLGLTNYHVMGSSMGGAIAQVMAYKYPQLVRSIILANSFITTDIKFALFAEGYAELIHAGISSRSLSLLLFGWLYSTEFLQQPDLVETMIAARAANPYPVTEIGYRAQMHALLQFNSEAWLSKIKTPCLVVHTSNDLIVQEAEGRRLASLIPHAEYHCIQNAAHIPRAEKPEEFNRVVQKFLALY